MDMVNWPHSTISGRKPVRLRTAFSHQPGTN